VEHSRHAWIKTKLLRPRIWDHGKEAVKDYHELLKMPNFGMSEREAKAVLSNVMGFTKESAIATRRAATDPHAAALAEGRKLITRFNCQGCHLVEGHGRAIKTLIGDNDAVLPPNLAAEGARVQGDWLWDYLHDPSRVSMRPWLSVRMPTFGFTDDQANAVIAYFTARDRQKPFLSDPTPSDPRSVAVGNVVFGMLQCARCHPSGAVQTTSADLAPSLLLAHDRLRYDWISSWIQDPQTWVPGTRMPNFFTKNEKGEIVSSVHLQLAAPVFAAQKQQLLGYFASEAEMNAYLSDAGKVTGALRDHIWVLSGGRRPTAATAPADSSPAASAAPVAGGAAGGR
jgi:mono/diheme cytochrome c family protein